MRKNKRYSKKLKSLYYTYSVKGLNLDRFIERLKKKGVELFDVKRKDERNIKICIKGKDREKFFAISKELCYTNIIELKEGGKLFPIAFFARNIGLVLGSLILIFCVYYSSNMIFDIDYRGTGKIFSTEMTEYLSTQGVDKFSLVSKKELPILEDKLMASFTRLSFVSCSKRGNRLIINSVLSKEPVKTIENVNFLYSDVEGEVKEIKVYRGTPTVNVGDYVKKGDLLVGGFATVKEQTVNVNVLAYVIIKEEKTFTYFSESPDAEEQAVILSEEEYGEGESINICFVPFENGYKYTVKTYYLRTLSCG